MEEPFATAFALAREAQEAGLIVVQLAPLRRPPHHTGREFEFVVALYQPDGGLWAEGSGETAATVRRHIAGWRRHAAEGDRVAFELDSVLEATAGLLAGLAPNTTLSLLRAQQQRDAELAERAAEAAEALDDPTSRLDRSIWAARNARRIALDEECAAAAKVWLIPLAASRAETGS